jgi:hypothetical protein
VILRLIPWEHWDPTVEILGWIMTALALNQIPSSVNTLEKAAVWLGSLLRVVDGAKSAVEVEGLLPERASQMPIIEAADGKLYAVVRLRVELDPAFLSVNTAKLWTFARPTTEGTIPATFTTN